MARLQPSSITLLVLLASLGAIAPITMDVFLPALPEVARALNTTPAEAQLTISSYLIGAAVGVVSYGPIADRYGRRPVLVGALVTYCLASAICMFATSIEVLVVGRALQALGPSCTTTLARAIIRDIYEGREMSRQMALMSTMMAVGPLIGPPLGGLILTFLGWRPIFILLFTVGISALFLTLLLLPETLKTRASEGLSFPELMRSYRILLRNRSYVAHISILSVTYLGLMTWLASAPFVLQTQFGLSPFAFSLMFVTASVGLILGMGTAARLVMRLGVDRCLGAGVVMLATAGVSMFVLVWINFVPTVSIVLTMTLYMFGYGFIGPQGLAGALAPFRDRAGTASSFTGFTQQAAGALLGVLIGRTVGITAMSLASMILGLGLASCVLWVVTRRVRLEAAAALLD